MLAAFAESALRLLYPTRCAACGDDAPAGPFCATCADALLEVGPGCERCGEPGPLPRCGPCLASPPAFDAVVAGGLLGGPLADAVHALKYGHRPALARPLGRWLAGRVRLPGGAAVIPVPLARERRVARGYDQAFLLAHALAGASGLRLLSGALRRVRETTPQVGQGRAARARNVAGAFAAARGLAGRDLVLVDDVVTTGATADAAAAALRAAGARSVTVAALARAV